MAPLRLRRGRGAMQGNPLRSKAVCNLPYPQGPSLVPSGQFTLCRQIRSEPTEAEARCARGLEEAALAARSDHCGLHCSPRTAGFFRQAGCLRPYCYTFFSRHTRSTPGRPLKQVGIMPASRKPNLA